MSDLSVRERVARALWGQRQDKGRYDIAPEMALADMLAVAGLLADPAHDAQVAAKAWDEGFETARRWNAAPMCRNPYRADAMTRQADTPAAPSDPPRKGNGPHRWGDRDVTNLPWTCPGLTPAAEDEGGAGE